MNLYEAYTNARAREAAARREAELSQERAARAQEASQRELRQLVTEVQHGQQLVRVQHAHVTQRARALHQALVRDFDTTAPDAVLAERIGCTESEAIAALAELVYSDLVAVRVEQGRRYLMASIL